MKVSLGGCLITAILVLLVIFLWQKVRGKRG